MSNNNSNEVAMVDNNEVVVASASAKLRTPMMRILCKSADHKGIMTKTAESTAAPGALCECHPQFDSPASPWAKFHSILCDPEIGAL